MYRTKIKELCKQKKILHKDLAKMLGISDVALRQALNGNPTIGTLTKIAKVLGVEVGELFSISSQTINCPNCGAKLRIKIEAESHSKD